MEKEPPVWSFEKKLLAWSIGAPAAGCLILSAFGSNVTEYGFLALFVGISLFQGLPLFFLIQGIARTLRTEHVGWKRLGLVIAVVGAVLGAFLGESIFRLEPGIGLFVVAPWFACLALALTYVARWLIEGFTREST